MVTLDLTDLNLWHFMNEIMLPTWHSLLNVDLIPAHVKRCVELPWVIWLVHLHQYLLHSVHSMVVIQICVANVHVPAVKNSAEPNKLPLYATGAWNAWTPAWSAILNVAS